MCHCHCHCALRRFPFGDDLVNSCDLEGTRVSIIFVGCWRVMTSPRQELCKQMLGWKCGRTIATNVRTLRTTTWCDSWPPSPQESHLLNPTVQHLWSLDELPEGPSFAITAFLKERVCRLRPLEISNEERGVCSVQLMTAEMSFGKCSALAPQSGAGCRLG